MVVHLFKICKKTVPGGPLHSPALPGAPRRSPARWCQSQVTSCRWTTSPLQVTMKRTPRESRSPVSTLPTELPAASS